MITTKADAMPREVLKKLADLTDKVIGVTIGIVIAIVVGAVAMTEALGAEAANWGVAGVALLAIVPIIFVAGLLRWLYSSMKGAK